MRKLIELIESLPEIISFHSPETKIFKLLNEYSKSIFESSNFNTDKIQSTNLGKFGNLIFPYTEFGSVSSLDIFSSLNELIIFSYYIKNSDKYKNVIDIGANIGLHSLLMAKLGWNVNAYEPDPLHFQILKKNILLNNLKNIKVFESAVSNNNGNTQFVRVKGNTTSSHIAGSKETPYGELETININIVDISDLTSNCDFIKIDAEGHEAEIICSIPRNDFLNLEIMVEVGSIINAEKIFKYCKNIGLNLFSQKNNWRIVDDFQQLPINYKEGSLFISSKCIMNWN